MWTHLPLRLLGKIFEARFPLWPGDVVYWYWIDSQGTHHRELAGSRDWLYDPMASVMRRYWSWWVLTDRDELLREGLYVPPWRPFSSGDAWEHVGLLDADSAVPWPWPRAA